MVQKASSKLTDMMQQAIAREIQVSVQYMWQHVMAKGLESAEIADVFEEVAIAEMKHAEKIAERIFYFDITPTTKPDPIKVGGTLKEMLKYDAKAEEEAIDSTKRSSNRRQQKVIPRPGCSSSRSSRMRKITTIRSRPFSGSSLPYE